MIKKSNPFSDCFYLYHHMLCNNHRKCFWQTFLVVEDLFSLILERWLGTFISNVLRRYSFKKFINLTIITLSLANILHNVKYLSAILYEIFNILGFPISPNSNIYSVSACGTKYASMRSPFAQNTV